MRHRVLQICLIALAPGAVTADERTERFDKDPNWESRNSRVDQTKPRTVRQDFGYSPGTANAGGNRGEIGGHITPCAESAYYGKKIAAKSLRDPLTASGRFVAKSRTFHLLLGFFNSGTVNEWRTPNTLSIRLQGRGDVFFAYVEYCSSQWRAGADTPGGFATAREPDTGRINLRGFRIGPEYRWSMKYDPNGNRGTGSLSVTIGDETAVCHLDPGHKVEGATFDRFGIMPVLKSADDTGEVWFDDIAINGESDDFSRDPQWDGKNNRRTFESYNVRPWFDFGFSETNHAGGSKVGELGGIVFRGDCRYREKLGAYGDRLSDLSLDKPLRASGKIALRRAVSDSTTLLGFYHSDHSLEVNPSQKSGIPKCFLGIAVEGPSSQGFFVYPMYRVGGEGQGYADGPKRPRILPNGKSHDWSLEYDPRAAEGKGRIVVTMDGVSTQVELTPDDRRTGARFNRFGIVTTWIDGNGQHVYFDDLTYTFKQ